jgi:hypothetical protein
MLHATRQSGVHLTGLPRHSQVKTALTAGRSYNWDIVTARRRKTRLAPAPRTAAARLFEAERLFADFVELTPYKFKPFVKTFDSFDEYERWKRAQTNPWYR